MGSFAVGLLLSVLACILLLPKAHASKLYAAGMFEGDIDVSQTDHEQIISNYGKHNGKRIISEFSTKKRRLAETSRALGATNNAGHLWKHALIYTVKKGALTDADTTMLLDAMKHIEDQTCFRFVERTDQRGFVEFDKNGACSSPVGYQGNKMKVYVGTHCGFRGNVHENLHAIGFWHEQSRPDRDKFTQVHWENVKADKRHNFNLRSRRIDSLGSPYDFGSVMHYRPWTFSKNGKPTITRLNGKTNGLGGSRLSVADTDQIRRLYNIAKVRPFVKYRTMSCTGCSWRGCSGCSLKWVSSKTCTPRPYFCLKNYYSKRYMSGTTKGVAGATSCGKNEQWEFYHGVLRNKSQRKVLRCMEDGSMQLTHSSDKFSKLLMRKESRYGSTHYSIKCVHGKYVSGQYYSKFVHDKSHFTGWAVFEAVGAQPTLPHGQIGK